MSSFLESITLPAALPVSITAIVIAIAALVVVLIGIKMILGFLRSGYALASSFHLKTILVLVPKETSKDGADTAPRNQDELHERISIAEQLFAAIGGLHAERGMKAALFGRSDHVAFEIVAKDGIIAFYVTAPTSLLFFIEQQITAQYPDAEIRPVDGYNIFTPAGTTAAATLVFRRQYFFPLKTYKHLETDALDGITNTLAKLEEKDGAAIQFVIRSARASWRNYGVKIAQHMQQGKTVEEAIKEASHGMLSTIFSIFSIFGSSKKPGEGAPERHTLSPLEQEMLKGLEEKASKAGMDVNCRIVVSTATPARADALLEQIVSAFSQVNIYEYGNGLRRGGGKSKKIINKFIYRHFDDHARMVFNTEEMATLFHFPLASTETPNILWLKAKSASAPINIPKEGLYLGDNVYRGVRTKIHMKTEDRRRHMYIIGMTGTGKSKWMDSLALQDIRDGKGVCFIDPHGDDVDLILSGIPKERADDVILFDPSDTERPLALNMLEFDPARPQEKTMAANEMLQIFDKLYDLKATGGPMFEYYMRNALLLLMEDPASGSTILEVPKLLADDSYRKMKLSRCKTQTVKDFWEKEAQKAGGEASLANMVPYIASKLTPFITNDLVRPIIAQQESSFSFRKAMDEQKIILVKLAKGKIGDLNANLLGMIVVGKILMAALGRSDMAEKDRKDFYLYIDEFQNFLTEGINVILSEARKYRLSLTIAHQFLGQLEGSAADEQIKKAVFGNVGTRCAFRIGVEDAEEMAKEFAPVFTAYDFVNCPAYNNFVKIMVDNENPPPFNMQIPLVTKMFDFNDDRANLIKELSRLKYGRDRQLVEAEIAERGRIAAPSVLERPRPASAV